MTLGQLGDVGFFSPFDLQFAATVARLAGDDHPDVRLGAALACRMTAAGHTCVDLRAMAGRRVELPGDDPEDVHWPSIEPWTAALRASRLVSRPHPRPRTPLVLDDRDRLFLTRYWEYQERLAGQLLARSSCGEVDLDEELLRGGLSRLFDDARQAQAARAAATRRLAVISGGPGTGKTTTVVRILALLQQQALAAGAPPLRVLLLAPTGKAAARLAETVRRAREGALARQVDEAVLAAVTADASTIHRALRWRPSAPTKFVHGIDHPLPADVVVVDEASMVDLALMTKLIEAVRADARLILLGDRDQLAAVETGATLGDICAAGLAVQLTHSYRFGSRSGIGRLAVAINEGDERRALELLRSSGTADLEWLEVSEERALVRAARPLLESGYGPLSQRSDPQQGLDQLGRFRVLTALRGGPFGADGLNALAGRILRPRRAQSWYPGQPILVLANDYGCGLFNGDTGLIDADAAGRLKAFFPAAGELPRAISPYRLPQHETVYAMTVHKSQGSEFDEVVVVLPAHPSPVVTRELLYTAVTRARRKVTVLAAEATLLHAVRTPFRRTSGLRDRLRAG